MHGWSEPVYHPTSPIGTETRASAGSYLVDGVDYGRPKSLAGLLVELLFYFNALNAAFALQTGTYFLAGLGGSLLLGIGVLTLLIMIIQREKITLSIWMVFVLNITVNISQSINNKIPFLDPDSRTWMFFLMNMIAVNYIVRNQAAFHRLLVVLIGILVTGVLVSGGLSGAVVGGRLELERVGSGLGDANALGYLAGFLCVALLFWSLDRGRTSNATLWLPISTVLWSASAVLIVILLYSVSRGAIMACACGLTVYCAAIMLGRGVRIMGIVTMILFVTGIAVLAGTSYWTVVSNQTKFLEDRFGQDSIRTRVYRWETVEDLWDTKVFGRGLDRAAVRSANIRAHNTFIHNHIAFGGITAYPYLLWLIILMWRIHCMLRSGQLPLDLKLQVVAYFGMGLAEQLLSNNGFMCYPSLIAFGIAEKYTAPFARRRMQERQYEQNLAAYAQLQSAGSAGGSVVQTGVAYR